MILSTVDCCIFNGTKTLPAGSVTNGLEDIGFACSGGNSGGLALAGTACSIAEIRRAINRPADALYNHLELLEQAGFVTDAGFRKSDRNIEKLFDVVTEDFMIDFKDRTGAAENKAIVATASFFLKAMARAVRDSAAARQIEFQPETRNISINYGLSWLTPESFQELRGLVQRIKHLMDDGKKRREGRLYKSLVVATPVTRRRGVDARTQKKARFASSDLPKPDNSENP